LIVAAVAGLSLAGHGSRTSPELGRAVWDAVDLLRQRGVAQEVGAAFWKQPPAWSRSLHGFRSDAVWVVPIFAAAGYFAQDVLPVELDAAKRRLQSPKRVVVTPPLGAHPRLPEIVLHRLRERLDRLGGEPHELAIVVVGHGTTKHAGGRRAVADLAESVRLRGWSRETVAAFLDDEPGIAEVHRLTTSPTIAVLPYFLAAGSHAGDDVPNALGLPSGAVDAEVRGRRVVYLPTIFDAAGVADLAVDLARQAGMPVIEEPGDDAWRRFPSAGFDEFVEDPMLAGAVVGDLKFDDEFVQTAGRPLETRGSHDLPTETMTPGALRRFVTSAKRLHAFAHGLSERRIAMPTPAHAAMILDTVYPGLLADVRLLRAGAELCDWPTTVGRQTGRQRRLRLLSESEIDANVEKHCAECILKPKWRNADRTGSCLEPCAHLLSETLAELDRDRSE
jgi:sirohydrochlorin cobaltochelatase